MTNTVKHFKWRMVNGARKHQTPLGKEIHACKPWLDAEIEKIKPDVIIALGKTAATALIGMKPTISKTRGRAMTHLNIAPNVIVSWHPSAILRTIDPAHAALKQNQLIADLKLAKQLSERPAIAKQTEATSI